MKNVVLFISLVLSVILGLYGEECLVSANDEARKPSVDQLKEGLMKRSGGFIMNRKSGEGFIAILNAQKLVSTDVVVSISKKIEDAFWLKTETAEKKVVRDFSKIEEVVKSSKGNVFVLLAELEAPSLLMVFPEIRCAVVNVRALVDDADEKKTITRVQKEMMRAVSFSMQTQYSKVPGGLMDPAVASLADLDKVLVEKPDSAMQAEVDLVCERFGLKKFNRTTYRKACERGEAPKPTNKYQQAIWDEFHELPSSPIRIMPESSTK